MLGQSLRRFLLSLACLLSITPLSATDLAISDLDPPPPVWAQLDNGFQLVHYGPKSSPEIVRLCLQVYVGWNQEHRDQLGMSEMLRQTVWEGTDEFSRIQILTFLDKLPMDPEQTGYTLPDSTIYELCVPAGDYAMLESCVHMLAQLAYDATLIDPDVEIIRQRLQEPLMMTRYILSLDDSKAYADQARKTVLHVAPLRVRSYYTNWYTPGNMVLHVTGPVAQEDLLEMVRYEFGKLRSTTPNQEQHSSPDIHTLPSDLHDSGLPLSQELAGFIHRLQIEGVRNFHQHGVDYAFVDGKILMEQAAWYETRFTRRVFTWGVTALGAMAAWYGYGHADFTCEMGGAAIAGVGILGAAVLSFDSDPAVVGERRAELLSKTFQDAVADRHCQLLLTPLELRQLFIGEQMERPDVAALSRSADFYRSPYTDMFQRTELELLRDGISRYRREANEFRRRQRALDETLQESLAVARMERDRSLARIEQEYDRNFFVVEERKVADRRSQEIRIAQQDYDQTVLSVRSDGTHMSEAEINRRIEAARQTLDRRISAAKATYLSDIKGAIEVGLAQARIIRDSGRAEIQRKFTATSEEIKERTGYNREIAALRDLIAAIDDQTNASLANALRHFEQNPVDIRDYIVVAPIRLD